MARIPIIHIPHKINPVTDGVSLLTDIVKSFIQFETSIVFVLAISPMVAFSFEVEDVLRFPSHKNICGNPIGRNGIKGTINSPSKNNHRLYCIRLDRLSLNILLAIKRTPMIPLIKTLHIKKRIIKLATSIASFF
jgi:hypothetical protein